MILSNDIGYARHMDSPGAAPDLNGDFSALLVVDFCIVPHCSNFPFKKAAERIIKDFSDNLDLKPISNNQAIIVEGERIKMITKGKKN